MGNTSGRSASRPSYVESSPSTPVIVGARPTMPGPCLARNSYTVVGSAAIVGTGVASPSRPVAVSGGASCYPPVAILGSSIRVRSADPLERHCQGALSASALSPRNSLRTIAGGSAGDSFTLESTNPSGTKIVYPALVAGCGSRQSLISPRSVAGPLISSTSTSAGVCTAGSRAFSPDGFLNSVTTASTTAMPNQQRYRSSRATLANPPGQATTCGAGRAQWPLMHVSAPTQPPPQSQGAIISSLRAKPQQAVVGAAAVATMPPRALTIVSSSSAHTTGRSTKVVN